MRKFDVLLTDNIKKKKLLYKDLEGQKAIKLMQELERRSFETVAFTYSPNKDYVETLTLEQMIEAVI